MGLLRWFFPSNEDRVAQARVLMGNKRYADARMEVMGVDTDGLDARVREEIRGEFPDWALPTAARADH